VLGNRQSRGGLATRLVVGGKGGLARTALREKKKEGNHIRGKILVRPLKKGFLDEVKKEKEKEKPGLPGWASWDKRPAR